MSDVADKSSDRLTAYFEDQSSFWKGIYEGGDVYSVIHQHRQRLALEWIDSLELAPGTRVLEIGCGAGLLAVALGRRGFDVEATDGVEAMIELAREEIRAAGLSSNVRARIVDAHALPYEPASFGLVVALGVIPWLRAPQHALDEMTRVVSPDGHVLVTADNPLRLAYLLDPMYSPALAPLRAVVKAVLHRLRRRRVAEEEALLKRHTPRALDHALTAAGLTQVRATTVGYGPFTLLGRQVVPERLGLLLHRALQRLADRRLRWIGMLGAQLIVLARKRR